MNQYRLKVHTWYSFIINIRVQDELCNSVKVMYCCKKRKIFSSVIKVYGPYHSVWKQSSVLVMPILTRKFLTKSSTISGL